MGLETTGATSMACDHPMAATLSSRRKILSGIILSRIIVSARGIHRIERWRGCGRLPLQDGVDGRQYGECGESADDEAADHGAAERGRLRSTFTESNGHWHHAEDHGRGSHQNGTQTAACSFFSRFEHIAAFVARAFGEGDQ